jgi:hypothetical protein
MELNVLLYYQLVILAITERYYVEGFLVLSMRALFLFKFMTKNRPKIRTFFLESSESSTEVRGRYIISPISPTQTCEINPNNEIKPENETNTRTPTKAELWPCLSLAKAGLRPCFSPVRPSNLYLFLSARSPGPARPGEVDWAWGVAVRNDVSRFTKSETY